MSKKRLFVFHGKDHWAFKQKYRSLLLEHIPEAFRELAFVMVDGREIDFRSVREQMDTPAFGSPVKLFVIQQYNKASDSAKLYQVLEPFPEDVFLVLQQDEPKFTQKKNESWLKKQSFAEVKISYEIKGAQIKQRFDHFLSEKGHQLKEADYKLALELLSLNAEALESEFEKIDLFFSGQNENNQKDLQQLLKSHQDLNIFALLDALFEKDHAQLLKHYLFFRQSGENLMRLLPLLFSEVKKIHSLLENIQAGISFDEAFRKAGAVPFLRSKYQSRVRNLNIKQVETFILMLEQVEIKLKSDYLTFENIDSQRTHLPAEQAILQSFDRFFKGLA